MRIRSGTGTNNQKLYTCVCVCGTQQRNSICISNDDDDDVDDPTAMFYTFDRQALDRQNEALSIQNGSTTVSIGLFVEWFG